MELERSGSPTEALLRAPALRLSGRASTLKIFPEDFFGDDGCGSIRVLRVWRY